jgi:catechol 2,3-dioxygenase-like lactoylglutathione lyase family enzyme
MSIKSLAHVCLKTKDLKRATDFYCGALGMKKLFNFTRKGEVIGFYLKASNETFIEMFRTEDIDMLNSARSLHHFCLETESIAESWQALADSGYSPREITMGADNSLQFWVTDPAGLEIEFQQYNSESSQFNGKDVEVT